MKDCVSKTTFWNSISNNKTADLLAKMPTDYPFKSELRLLHDLPASWKSGAAKADLAGQRSRFYGFTSMMAIVTITRRKRER